MSVIERNSQLQEDHSLGRELILDRSGQQSAAGTQIFDDQVEN